MIRVRAFVTSTNLDEAINAIGMNKLLWDSPIDVEGEITGLSRIDQYYTCNFYLSYSPHDFL